MKRRWIAGLFLACFIISGCNRSAEHQQAPDFTLEPLEKTAPVTLSALHQKSPVLLIFWATWCPSCVDEIPALNEIRSQYSEDQLQLLAVNVQESREQIAAFAKKHPMQYPILLDETGDVAARYGLVGLPASVLLAKGGEILYYGFSLPPNLDQWLEPRRVQ